MSKTIDYKKMIINAWNKALKTSLPLSSPDRCHFYESERDNTYFFYADDQTCYLRKNKNINNITEYTISYGILTENISDEIFFDMVAQIKKIIELDRKRMDRQNRARTISSLRRFLN